MKIGEFLKEKQISVGDNVRLLFEELGVGEEVLKRLEAEAGEIAKMSKSKGNVVDPEQAIEKYGSDTIRLYVLFAAPPEQDFEWTEEGIQGAYRFLMRLWNFVVGLEDRLREVEYTTEDLRSCEGKAKDLRREIHSALKGYLRDMEERYQLNTAIARIMKLLNALTSFKPEKDTDLKVVKEGVETLLIMLSPIAPHICEELWQRIGGEGLIVNASLPQVDESALELEEIELPVQINGKLKAKVKVPANAGEEEVKEIVLSQEKIKSLVEGKEIKRFIYIEGRLVNLVVGG